LETAADEKQEVAASKFLHDGWPPEYRLQRLAGGFIGF